MMVTLSQDAQGYLERYLRQLKAALRGHRTVDAAEVERDVLGHIEAELAGQPEPIGASTLRQVLGRLGTPDTWVPVEELPSWRRTINRLRSGPEDWRLAYLSFASFLLAPTLFLAGPFLWPLEPLLMVVSFLFARASLAVLAEHDEHVGARRWLVYPPLVVCYVLLVSVILIGPLPLLGAMLASPAMSDRLQSLDYSRTQIQWIVRPGLFVLGIGVWWTVAGAILMGFADRVRVVFWPFADWFDRRHALRLALGGVFLVILAAVTLMLGAGLPSADR